MIFFYQGSDDGQGCTSEDEHALKLRRVWNVIFTSNWTERKHKCVAAIIITVHILQVVSQIAYLSEDVNTSAISICSESHLESNDDSPNSSITFNKSDLINEVSLLESWSVCFVIAIFLSL